EVKSVRKKFKNHMFAAGCSREVITTGAERLGWELDKLFEMTIEAMKSCEKSVNDYMEANY
ncbi:MAG TPA: hydrolase, partial [Sphaerochaeta sp.]|nr:hydrolase [Sphaerochaeta sp.]